jgi:hypothetical protein
MDEVDARNVVGCRWVFALKRGPDGAIERYKARIVAKGFSQIYQIDYHETFASYSLSPRVLTWRSTRWMSRLLS